MRQSNLHPALAATLAARGYDTLTPVQSEVLKDEAQQRDLIVSAKTGSAAKLRLKRLRVEGRLPFTMPDSSISHIRHAAPMMSWLVPETWACCATPSSNPRSQAITRPSIGTANGIGCCVTSKVIIGRRRPVSCPVPSSGLRLAMAGPSRQYLLVRIG